MRGTAVALATAFAALGITSSASAAPTIATTLTVQPSVLVFGPTTLRVPLEFRGRLTQRGNGASIAGQQVKITIGNGLITVCKPTTDAVGGFVCPGDLANILASVLQLGWDASYAGNATFQSSKAHAPAINVNQVPVL
ncbi:hypothetical protein PAI11_14790 [Patulibacter medicamentivorans]|uniref:Uncharacterized protein n=2 Tax=Patulibacter medicamentivorans TaxID=1097667 RepID=H0E3V4_9ACTN|nr:hypothetical protein PAI11_14790 [Patulibacter medicamentivorans]